MPGDEDQPVVFVRVMVNVEGLRVGEEAEVEVNPRIQKMIDSGYLQILGHVLPAAAAHRWAEGPYDAAPPPAVPLASPTRVRAIRKEAADGAAGADPS